MSSQRYVTQQNTPLDDDTTLMSTTDLHSNITHANDTFVNISGYSLNELLAQPHNPGASSGYAESGLCRHVVHPAAGRAVEWHRQEPP